VRSHHTFCTLPRGCTHLRGRKISPQDSASDIKTDYDYIIPIVDPSSLDLRCGRNASTAWSHPKTAVVRAGESVGFAVNTTVGLPIPNAPVMPWDVSEARFQVLKRTTLTYLAALAKPVPPRSSNSVAFCRPRLLGRVHRRWGMVQDSECGR
jgi:hypothetical protein